MSKYKVIIPANTGFKQDFGSFYCIDYQFIDEENHWLFTLEDGRKLSIVGLGFIIEEFGVEE